MKKSWKILGAKTIFKNLHSNIEIWKVRTHRGKHKDFTISQGQDFMVMLAVTKDNKLVTIRQYYLNEGKKIYSLVAGYIDFGEKKAAAARRELREETGYDCKKIVYLGKSSKGKYSTGHAHYFLGLGAFKSQEQNLEEAEDIDVVLVHQRKFVDLLNNNKFLDVYTEVCARRAWNYLNKKV